ncbi:Bro-N domain-containing protein [Psychrobacter sp.]|uniref:BRO-N domain-containing protein n=1 Tax=Psychrobacter sp. TaxID=56811 RepID=UPI003BB14890
MQQYNTASNQGNNTVMALCFENKRLDTKVIDDELWIAATNLAQILGFANPRQAIATHVEVCDVQKLDVTSSDLQNVEVTSKARKTQKLNFVNESGMYALIFGSTKPEAKRFKHWVTSQVLPRLRKTGSYKAAPIAKQYSDNDIQRLKDSLTLPELAKLLQTSETEAAARLADSFPNTRKRYQRTKPVLTPELQYALDQFWGFVATQDIKALNHSQKSHELAISIPEVYALADKGQLPDTSLIYKALRLSDTPDFHRANTVIASAIYHKSRRVWVFIKSFNQPAITNQAGA